MSRIVCACHYYPESLCPENEMTDQPEALRLADYLEAEEWPGGLDGRKLDKAAAELRRQHDQIERLAAEVANRNRRALAGDEAVAGLANVHAYYEGIEAERDALKELLDDYTDDYKAVVNEQCAGDEVHCSCVPHLRKRIKEVEAERDAAVKAITKHNDECQSLCGNGDSEASACGYRQYFEATGRRCSDCPTYHKIDWPQNAAIDAAKGDK